jgi:formylglycine-generating enzyme required for sulfatase activity
VGSTPQGAALWGQQDLSGNVWEWAFDYQFDTQFATYPSPESNYATTASNGIASRVVHGGCFQSQASDLQSAVGTAFDPVSNVGFRCARKVQ